MIYMLTPDMVLFDVLGMARAHMSEVLKCSPMDVKPSVIRNENGTLDYRFQVSMEVLKGLEPDIVQRVMENIYTECKAELFLRLRHNNKRREDVLKECRGDVL